MHETRGKPYVKWGLTALVVIFVSILLVVIFTDLPGIFGVLTALEMILEPLIFGVVIAFLLHPIVRFVDSRLLPLLEQKTKSQPALIRNLRRAATTRRRIIPASTAGSRTSSRTTPRSRAMSTRRSARSMISSTTGSPRRFCRTCRSS